MAALTMKELLEAGVHFGHQTKRWNPKMQKYIFGERNGIYIIDLQKTLKKFREAYGFVRDLAAGGGTVLFIGTKKQAQETVFEEASRCGMFYVNQRWLGGTLTNFTTIRKSITRLKKQMERLFLATLTVRWEGDQHRQAGGRLNVASSYDLWWLDKDPDELALMPSVVKLSREFYDEVTQHPVPLDLAVLGALRGSALRLDIYAFLCHRLSYLRRPTTIPWEALRGQFGSTLGKDKAGRARFKQEFERNLREVLLLYRYADVESTRGGLVLKPSRTSVPMRRLRSLPSCDTGS